jgi:peptide/nickel transport system permease protein
MSTLEPKADLAATPELALTGDGAGANDLGAPRGKRFETLHFAFHNTKLVIGLSVVLLFLIIAIIGPLFTDADPFEFGYPLGVPPSTEYWLGTTSSGQDVYAQFVYGLRSSFVVGALAALVAGTIGMSIGFVGGYLGGVIDEILSMLTNIVLVIPTLAVLIIVAAYLEVGSLWSEALLIGFTSWPWAARAIRAQTFSLAARDFVNLARLSGRGTIRVIVNEIAPNMSSYLFLTLILLFGGSVLTAATLDFLGLGPSQVMSLGLMMNTAVTNAALQLGLWWWFIPPGIAITGIVGGLYVMNVGLDEVFNPKLRNT